MPPGPRHVPCLLLTACLLSACKDDGSKGGDGDGIGDGDTGGGETDTADDGDTGSSTGDGGDDGGNDGTLCGAGDLEDVWRELAPMPGGPREALGVAALADQLWVIGGIGEDGGTGLTTTEIYDPAADTWSAGPELPVVMASPNVVSTGGTLWILGYVVGTTAEGAVYRLEADAWVEAGAFPDGRERGNSGLLEIGGQIHLVGGLRAGDPVPDHDAFDPTAVSFTERASLPSSRDGLVLNAIDGLVLAIGGKESTTGSAMTRVDQYDVDGDAWSNGTELPVARADATTFVLDGELHVCGGVSTDGAVSARCDRYEPEGDCWREIVRMPAARHKTDAVIIGDRAYVPGGASSRDLSPTDTLFEFDTW